MKMFSSVFLAFCLCGFAASSQLNEIQAAGQDSVSDDPRCGCSKEPVPQCGCCAEFEYEEKEHKACMNITYVKGVKGLRLTVTYDGEVVFNETIDATNPPPFCQGICKLGFCICETFYNMSYGDDKKWGGCFEITGRVIVPVLDIKFGCFYLPMDDEETLDETIDPVLKYVGWAKVGINDIQQWFQKKLNKMNEWRNKQKNPLDFLFKNRVEDEKKNIEVPDID